MSGLFQLCHLRSFLCAAPDFLFFFPPKMTARTRSRLAPLEAGFLGRHKNVYIYVPNLIGKHCMPNTVTNFPEIQNWSR
jgi:hypothetical protein